MRHSTPLRPLALIIFALACACSGASRNGDGDAQAHDAGGSFDTGLPRQTADDGCRVDQGNQCAARADCLWVDEVGCFSATSSAGEPVPQNIRLNGLYAGQTTGAPSSAADRARMTLYVDQSELRGVVAVRRTQDDRQSAVSYRVIGRLLDGRTRLVLRLIDARCVDLAGGELCADLDATGPESPDLVVDGFYDDELFFEQVRPAAGGTYGGFFDDLVFQPHDGFKPSLVGHNSLDWSELDTKIWAGELHIEVAGAPWQDQVAECTLEAPVEAAGPALRALGCATETPEAADFQIHRDSFSYDPASRRFWFTAELDAKTVLFAGSYEGDHLAGVVVDSAAHWSAQATPSDPLDLPVEDVIGAFRFDENGN